MNAMKRSWSLCTILLTLALATSLVALPGCWRTNEGADTGPAEQAGRRLDQATDRAGRGLAKAGEGLDRTTEKVGRRIEQTGVDIQESTRD